MSERTMPGLGLRAFYEEGASDWGQPVSEDLRKLSALVQLSVISRETALPDPGSAGDIYIVPESAASNAGEIALWDGEDGAEAWVFIQPAEGWMAYLRDEGDVVLFDGTGWSPFAGAGGGTELPELGGNAGKVLTVNDAEDDTKWGAARPKLDIVRQMEVFGRQITPDDHGRLIEIGHVPTQMVIPPFALVALGGGTWIRFFNSGTLEATIEAAFGVSLNGVVEGAVTVPVGAMAHLFCSGTQSNDQWYLLVHAEGEELPELSGHAGRFLAVAASEDGVEWVDLPGGGGDAGASFTFTRGQDEDYTLQPADHGRMLEFMVGDGNAHTITIPDPGAVSFPVGARIRIAQFGSGTLSVAAHTNTALNMVFGGAADLDGPFTRAEIYQADIGFWVIHGDIGAVS